MPPNNKSRGLLRAIALLITVAGVGLAAWAIDLAWTSFQGQVDAGVQWANHPTPWRRVSDVDSAYTPRILSRISFPSLDRRLFVFDGESEANLLLGPIHVEGSARPGERGNCIIAAHRDTHFRILKNIRQGDEIKIESDSRTVFYRVESLNIVRSADDKFYRPTEDPILTLVTCYPFYYIGSAPNRFIVRARLRESPPQQLVQQ